MGAAPSAHGVGDVGLGALSPALEPGDQAAQIEGIKAHSAAEADRGELAALDQALYRARVDVEHLSGLAGRQERGPIVGEVGHVAAYHRGWRLDSSGF